MKLYLTEKRDGYGEDLYIITVEQESLQKEFKEKGVNVVKEIFMTDYGNKEFTIEDIDGRRLVFGRKQWNDSDDEKQWVELYSRAKQIQNDIKIKV